MEIEEGIDCRLFKASDAEPLQEVIVENLLQVNSQDYSRSIIEAMIPMYEPPRLIEKAEDHLMLVCYQQGQLVGTASLDGDQVRNVYVKVSHHGQGIGARLMREIEQVAADRGLASVMLYAAISAEGFYKRLGYKRVESVERSIGSQSIQLIEMRKAL